ncbi:MAG: cation:proton antiporter [Candidatus Omnitrophica bacterium]|nr:cation:proton antiporter [Candidatus Omnitrophota bacterium]
MNAIFSLGFILLFGLVFARLINRIKFPSVTAYLILGILIGPSLANLVSADLFSASGFISNLVLGLIAFSIGQNFSRDNFRKIGRSVIWISLSEAAGAWIMVTSALFFILKQPFHLSLLFGAISAATAPAATVMVIREYKSRGGFTDVLLGVVAIDDAWCLIIFALSLAIAKSVSLHLSSNLFIFRVILKSMLEIGGAFVLGWIVSLLASGFSKYIRTSTEALIYSLGFIFFTIGLSILLHFSVLLACMFLGASLVNLKKTELNFFDTIRTIDPPLYLLFFVLAGANLELHLIKNIGLIGLVYLVFRILGKIGGVSLAGYIVRASESIRKYLGFALVPQAGVALGCALIAKSEFPQFGGLIFTTIIATTVVYELIGPLCTKYALEKSGNISAPGT